MTVVYAWTSERYAGYGSQNSCTSPTICVPVFERTPYLSKAGIFGKGEVVELSSVVAVVLLL